LKHGRGRHVASPAHSLKDQHHSCPPLKYYFGRRSIDQNSRKGLPSLAMPAEKELKLLWPEGWNEMKPQIPGILSAVKKKPFSRSVSVRVLGERKENGAINELNLLKML